MQRRVVAEVERSSSSRPAAGEWQILPCRRRRREDPASGAGQLTKERLGRRPAKFWHQGCRPARRKDVLATQAWRSIYRHDLKERKTERACAVGVPSTRSIATTLSPAAAEPDHRFFIACMLGTCRLAAHRALEKPRTSPGSLRATCATV